MHTLATIPQEVLEHIAFYTGTHSFLGPPSDLIPLLGLNHRSHAALSIDSNPHLWARIFAYKFDLSAAVRRIGQENTTPVAIAQEFRRRCELLKRIRACTDTVAPTFDVSKGHQRILSSVLWMAYLMMLENDGKNESQLREYARIDEWLKQYLLHPSGASLIRWSVRLDRWAPGNDERISLAMWLFWMLLKTDDYMMDDTTFRDAMSVLKLIALGAHQYVLCSPTWREFVPSTRLKDPSIVPYFGCELRLAPPAPAAPAVLAYLTLHNKLSVSWDAISYMRPVDPTVPSEAECGSAEWEAEWARGIHIAEEGNFGTAELSDAFVPGSLEGSWEGLFTYTEFTAYAALLSGASPSVLERSLLAQHPQLWKLREHHLYAQDEEEDGSVAVAGAAPLSPGAPLRAYIPVGTELHEGPGGLEVREPGRPPVIYESFAYAKKRGWKRRVRDIIITGEGHSAWGQFNLVGRIRPCDGFISLCKDYTHGERGRWLYRSYMVGNTHGNLSGRWRDTLSPSDVLGYEGCFLMSRRR